MRAMIRRGLDPQLVSAARAGNPAALDALIAQSLPLVYNIAGRALRGHADADDVVQETMLRVVRGLGDLRDPDAYRSWLAAITVRQVRDFLAERRAATVRSEPLDEAREAVDPSGDFADVTILRLGLTDQRRDVVEATRWLDQDDRELLSLWWLEENGELERADLAGALGVTPPHAAVRVQRMKEHLDTARTVVRALRSTPRCVDLSTVARPWDGMPNPLWRKRIARHVRHCVDCGGRSRGLVPVARLLQGLPLVPLPIGYGARMIPVLRAGAQAGASSAGSGATHAGAAAKAAVSGHRALKTARRGSRLLHLLHIGGAAGTSAMTPVVAVGAVAAVVAAGVVVATHKSDPAQTPVAAPSVTRLVSAPAASPSSPSPAPTSASPSHSSVAAAPPPASDAAKKGVSVWTFAGSDSALAQSTASWYFDWNVNNEGISAPGVGFVPMITNASAVTSANLATAKSSGSPYLLSFNEPDMAAQANMSVSQALDLWPQLEATGLKLGAPAVATGAANPGGWLDQFMAGAQAKGYRVDFIALHWYGGDFDTPAAVSQLEQYIQAVYDRYHLPIWLTEYALINFSASGASYPTQAQQAAFVTSSIQMLDSLSYVQRYAWFALPATSGSPTGLFATGPSVTQIGKAFEAAP